MGGGGAGGGGGSGGGADAGNPDAGPRLDSGYATCAQHFAGGIPNRDIIHVQGDAGFIGPIDFTLWGYSAGGSGPDGTQRFTGKEFLTGTPTTIDSTGLWMWTGRNTSVVTGQWYSGINQSNPLSDVPWINFRVSTYPTFDYVTCPRYAGSGTFFFERFSATSGPTEGVFQFSCPDAGIDVSGCFYFP